MKLQTVLKLPKHKDTNTLYLVLLVWYIYVPKTTLTVISWYMPQSINIDTTNELMVHLKDRIGYQKWNRLFGVLFCLLRVRLWLLSKQLVYKFNKKLYTKYINLLLNIFVHEIIVFGYCMSASGYWVNSLFTEIINKFIKNSLV